ncbi:MAG TPA: heme-binding protein [Lysobacter sp.]|nr:heme-binding protein [Lysobacter sp.]
MRARQELTLADCEKIMAACLAEARRNKWIVAVAILDDGGHLLMLARMDGATPANASIATEKGRTAAVSRRSSGMWEQRIKEGRNSMLKMPGILPVQGGMPILADGGCVGAVGVSGVQSHEDEQIAQAGIDALLK